VNGSQQQTKQYTADAEPQVRVAQKRIVCTDPTGRRQNHRLSTVEHFHWVCCVHDRYQTAHMQPGVTQPGCLPAGAVNESPKQFSEVSIPNWI